MSLHAATALGQSWQRICTLHQDELITDKECQRAIARLRGKAEKFGVGISSSDVFGRKLFGQIRIHWIGTGGHPRERLFSQFGNGAER